MALVQITHDYYAILEISNTADIQIFPHSYKKLALTHHPDKQPDNPNATVEFQIVSSPVGFVL